MKLDILYYYIHCFVYIYISKISKSLKIER